MQEPRWASMSYTTERYLGHYTPELPVHFKEFHLPSMLEVLLCLLFEPRPGEDMIFTPILPPTSSIDPISPLFIPFGDETTFRNSIKVASRSTASLTKCDLPVDCSISCSLREHVHRDGKIDSSQRERGRERVAQEARPPCLLPPFLSEASTPMPWQRSHLPAIAPSPADSTPPPITPSISSINERFLKHAPVPAVVATRLLDRDRLP